MTDNGDAAVPAGNVCDKYSTRHPVERWLTNHLLRTIGELASSTGTRSALEVGCGEGYISRMLAGRGLTVQATDMSARIIDVARQLTPGSGIVYSVRAIEDLHPDKDAAPLVVAIEVLEHVKDPEASLKKLASLARPYLLLSVPQEPLWRALNMLRGRYLGSLGNTPGHRNHWTPGQFKRLVSRFASIEKFYRPLPWSVILARV